MELSKDVISSDPSAELSLPRGKGAGLLTAFFDSQLPPSCGKGGRKGHSASNSSEAAPISQEQSSKECYRSKLLAAAPVATCKRIPQESG